MKVAICTPTGGEVKTSYVESLLGLLARPRVGVVTVQFTQLSSIHLSRNYLAANALSTGADHILWLDSDQTFPPDTLERLLAHGLPLVGCNIPIRRQPFSPTAQIGDTEVWTTPEKVSAKLVEPVDFIGLGVVLTEVSIFRKLKDPFGYIANHGEDYSFCQRARQLGIRPHVDHALSWEIGHIGEVVIRHEHALMGRRGNAGSVQSSSGAQ